MYTALVCFALFDARGTIELVAPYQIAATALLATVLLGLRYVPSVIHRPQLVDAMCEDLLCVAAHGICALLVLDPILRYACVLHSTCHLLQYRFMGKPRIPGTLVHTAAILWLAVAYAYGPRISDVKPFIVAVAYPNVMDLFARALTHAHRLAVLWVMEEDT